MLTEAAAQLGLVPVTLGYRPWGTTADIPWMPTGGPVAAKSTEVD